MTFANDIIIDASEILVLITIPMQQKRYETDVRKASQKIYFGKPKEFAKIESWKHGEWKAYKENIVFPVLSDITELHQKSNCILDYEITFKNFKTALQATEFKGIFLLAHHIKNYGKKKLDYIEFADGGALTTKVTLLLQSGIAKQKSIFLFVCNSKTFEAVKIQKNDSLEYIGTTAWNTPTIAGFNFIKHWILSMNRKKTLSESYAEAIETFLQEN